MRKQFLVAAAIAVCCLSFVHLANGVSVVNLAEDSHNIYQCPDPTSIASSPLCQFSIKESGQFFTVITKTVDCPESGINKNKIACIIVKDNVANDNGGYASINNGGLNQYFVDIYLKSQMGKGIDFSIEVYTVATNSTLIA